MSVQSKSQPSRPTRSVRSQPGPRRAAFYDLDGTLADLNLVHSALFILSNLGEWSGRLVYLSSFAARAPRLYLAERLDRHLLNVVLFETFKGVSRDRLEALGEEYCERILLSHLYPRAIEMIEANRAAGLEPILVTGSPDFIVRPLARHLRIETYAANRLAFLHGKATGRLHEPVMAGNEKSAWCARWADGARVELKNCWGYADSIYDLPFLCALGHPVAVNPDRKLRATAHSRHWPILSFDHSAPRGIAASMVERRLHRWVGRAINGAS